MDAFILQRPPKALAEDVVQLPGFAIHGDLCLGPLQAVGSVEGRELRSLVGIQDLGRAELVDGLVQCLDAEVCLQRV